MLKDLVRRIKQRRCYVKGPGVRIKGTNGYCQTQKASYSLCKNCKYSSVVLNHRFSEYSSCDLLNNALRFISKGEIEWASEEIVFAIEKAGGYFHDDVQPFVRETRIRWRERHRK